MYAECVCVALGIQYATRMHYDLGLSSCIIDLGLSGCTIFSTVSHKWHDFRRKKNVIEHKMRVLIFSTIFIWNISHSKKKWARYDQKCIWVFM